MFGSFENEWISISFSFSWVSQTHQSVKSPTSLIKIYRISRNFHIFIHFKYNMLLFTNIDKTDKCLCSCSLLLDEFTGRIETNGKKPCSHFQHHPWVIIGYLFRFSSIPSFYRRHIFKRCHPFGASRCKNFDYNKWFSHFFRCTRVCVRVPQAFTWKLFLCSGLFFHSLCSAIE